MDLASLEIKIARSENLPVLPQIVSSIMKLADDPNASAKAMETIIEKDPAITAKILKVSNSAYYGHNQVPSVSRAISILGINAVKSLVVSIAYQQVISGRQQAEQFNRIAFWQHSLATAIAARILGKLKAPLKAEELYIAGMMHDVGMLVMDRFCPSMLDDTLKMCRNDGLRFYEAELMAQDFDHAIVGGLLAEKWGLSPVIKHGIRYHHTIDEDPEHGDTTSIVAAANILAHQCGLRNNDPIKVAPPEDKATMEALELEDEQLEVIKTVILKEVNKTQGAFHIAA